MPILSRPVGSLEDLPAEVRYHLWRLIYSDILAGIEDDTYAERAAAWRGLALVSRGIRAEVSKLWPRTMIPYHSGALSEISRNQWSNLATGLSKSLRKSFSHLSLQLPEQPIPLFRNIVVGLKGLSEYLRVLEITFVGQDQHANETGFSECLLGQKALLTSALSVLPQPTPFLAPDWASHQGKDVILWAVRRLTRLTKLKLSNLNRPIFYPEIGLKPNLEILELLCDSRTQQYRYTATGIFARWNVPLDLKRLTMTANAVIAAMKVTEKTMPSLEDLTYIIPQAGWQQDQAVTSYIDGAAAVLTSMAHVGHKLRRFRLCVEGHTDEYVAHQLLYSLSQKLSMTRLQYLEIHANFQPFSFGAQFVGMLPPSLRRLHVSEDFVSFEQLRMGIVKRYFGQRRWVCDTSPTQGLSAHQRDGYLECVSYPKNQEEAFKLELMKLNFALVDRVRNSHLFDVYRLDWPTFGGYQGNLEDWELENLRMQGKQGIRNILPKDAGPLIPDRSAKLTNETGDWFQPQEFWQQVINAERENPLVTFAKNRWYPKMREFGRVEAQFDLYLAEVPRDSDDFPPYELLKEGPKSGCGQHWTI